MGKIVEEKERLGVSEIVTRVLAGVMTVSLVAVTVNLVRFNILPMKFLIPVLVLVVLLIGLVIFFAFFRKKKIFKIIAIILAVIVSLVAGFGFFKLNDTINFFEENLGENENVSIYNIMVSKDSSLSEDSDLTGVPIYTYRDLTLEKKMIKTEVEGQVGGEVVFMDEVLETVKMAVEDGEKVVAINAGKNKRSKRQIMRLLRLLTIIVIFLMLILLIGCASVQANSPVCQVQFDLSDTALLNLNLQNKRAVKSFYEICKK